MTRVNRSPIPPDMIRQYRDQRYAQQMNESLNNAQARRADIQQTGGISPSSIAMQRAQQANQLGVRSAGLEQAQAGILGQQNAARSMGADADNAMANQTRAGGEAAFNNARAFDVRMQAVPNALATSASAYRNVQEGGLAGAQASSVRQMLPGMVQRQDYGNQMIGRGMAAPNDVQLPAAPQGGPMGKDRWVTASNSGGFLTIDTQTGQVQTHPMYAPRDQGGNSFENRLRDMAGGGGPGGTPPPQSGPQIPPALQGLPIVSTLTDSMTGRPVYRLQDGSIVDELGQPVQ